MLKLIILTALVGCAQLVVLNVHGDDDLDLDGYVIDPPDESVESFQLHDGIKDEYAKNFDDDFENESETIDAKSNEKEIPIQVEMLPSLQKYPGFMFKKFIKLNKATSENDVNYPGEKEVADTVEPMTDENQIPYLVKEPEAIDIVGPPMIPVMLSNYRPGWRHRWSRCSYVPFYRSFNNWNCPYSYLNGFGVITN